MNKANPTYDVFISYNRADKELADKMAQILHSYDLQVFTGAEIPFGAQSIEETIWEAMAESQAVLAVISETEPSASMAFELGAAKAWNKPVYGIVADPSTRLPTAFHDLPVYPPSRIDEVARAIKRSSETLSASETDVLVDEYRRTGVPVDQLALQPKRLSELTKQFQKRTTRQMPGEQLMRFLLRLRKQRSLPSLSKGSVPRAS